jgi:hypothetical protein
MLRIIGRSVLVVMGCSLVSLAFPACDVEQPGDELARDLEDEEDEDEAPEGQRPAGSDELTNASDPSAAANYFVPAGTHDSADCNVLTGWAKDGDTTAPTWVAVYRGAAFENGGNYVTTAYANIYRSDLPFADKNHGFSIATPALFKNGTNQHVYIHAINIDVNGDWGIPGVHNPLLSSTNKIICCNPNGTVCEPGGTGSGSGGPTTGYIPE